MYRVWLTIFLCTYIFSTQQAIYEHLTTHVSHPDWKFLVMLQCWHKHWFILHVCIIIDKRTLWGQAPACVALWLNRVHLILHTWHTWHEPAKTWLSGEPSPSSVETYLGGPVGVHLNHVLGTLFNLELNVVLSFQGGEAAAACAHSGLAVRGIWGQRAFWIKVGREKKRQVHVSTYGKQWQTWLCMCCWNLAQICTDCK